MKKIIYGAIAFLLTVGIANAALEDLTGASKFIDDLVNTNPAGGDSKGEGDDHVRGIKNVLLNTFPNVTGAITATQAELNTIDGYTGTTAELNKVVGLTAGTILTTGDEGTGNGIDADTVDGNEATALLARANHTGTQTMSTISDAGAFATSATIDGGELTYTSSASAGIAQGQVFVSYTATTGSPTYATKGSVMIYIDPTWVTMTYRVRSGDLTSGGSGGINFRLTATATGTASQETVDDTWDTTGGTIDVSGESGWTEFNIQLNNTSGTSGPMTAFSWAITS